jgi:hypothetical protein
VELVAAEMDGAIQVTVLLEVLQEVLILEVEVADILQLLHLDLWVDQELLY